MPTTIRLDPETEARLDRLAARTGRAKAYYLRELITEGLDRIEWECDLASRAAAVRAGKVKSIPLDDLMEELGLDD